MKFATVINCMDGRVQLPVIEYMKQRFEVDYVDDITEPGPNRILAERDDETSLRSILNCLQVSVKKHQSVGVAVVGHHDCAGNPVSQEKQMEHLREAARFLRGKYAHLPIIALWVDERWKVREVPTD